jgi:hypothetical protein
MAQLPNREAAYIPEFDAWQVGPEALAGVQLWGRGGEARHLEPWRRAIGQERGDARPTVDGRAVPAHHHRAGHLAPQGLEQRHHSASVESTVLAVDVPLALG